jgi:hypothetical protein
MICDNHKAKAGMVDIRNPSYLVTVWTNQTAPVVTVEIMYTLRLMRTPVYYTVVYVSDFFFETTVTNCIINQL